MSYLLGYKCCNSIFSFRKSPDHCPVCDWFCGACWAFMLHLLLLLSKKKTKGVCDSFTGISTHIIKLACPFI